MLHSYVWFLGRYYFCIRIPQPHCSNHQVDLSCKSAICQRAATNRNTPPPAPALFTEYHCTEPEVWHLRTRKVGKDCSRCCRNLSTGAARTLVSVRQPSSREVCQERTASCSKPAFLAQLWTLKVHQSHQKWDKKAQRRQNSKELY